LSESPAAPQPGGTTPRGRLALGAVERRAVAALSAIYGIRMLGLFLMLPVLFLYAWGLPGATPMLAGLAVGVFGLVQALLQLPLGIASDRFGRHRVIALGLVVYAAGSACAAAATGIGALLAARMLQGAGAVSGPVTALLADLTRSEVRTRAMALIGISIGAAFVVGLIGAPPLSAAIGVPGLFWATAALAGFALLLLFALVPRPARVAAAGRPALGSAFRAELWPHYAGILTLNGVLTATFVAAQTLLERRLAIPVAEHWRTYLGVFLASLPPTVPLVLLTERARNPGRLVRFAIALLAAALAGAALLGDRYWPLAAALTLFFTAFNFLEARLPARLSQVAPPEARGAALSVFATAQSLGSFAGSASAGWLTGTRFGPAAALAAAALASLAWCLLYRPRHG
jgi:predicted MFS family arabinose efflux permease